MKPELLEDWSAALRENWARDRVAAAGKSWNTHMAKFDGTVLRRVQPTVNGIRGHQVFSAAEEEQMRKAAEGAFMSDAALIFLRDHS